MRVSTKLKIPFLNRCYGSGIVAAGLVGQKRLPFLPRQRIERIRDQRIRRVVRYAARKVPYYRDLFAGRGIDPSQIKGAAELDQLPVLDKELVRARPELFMADGSVSRKALSFLTSGTTGVPIEVHHDRRSLLANIAFGEREREPFINICGGSFRPKELYVGYETSTFKKVIAFYQQSVLFPVRPRRRFVSLLEPIENIAAIINTERPDILVGYGGWIGLFFRTVAARKIDLKPPRMVMYMGEAIPHGSRDYIEGHLGIPVLSRYNAVESFKIGFFCEERSGFHIHEDLCHVRIVGTNGQNVPVGEQGEVVISNLINRASVLLNYPMGDLAALSADGVCACGRTFRRISELEGRTEDILVLPDGGFLHPRAIWQVLKSERDILQYQLIQHELHRFTLEIVTTHESHLSAIQDRISGRLEALLGQTARVKMNHRPDIIRRSGQKFRAVVSRVETRT